MPDGCAVDFCGSTKTALCAGIVTTLPLLYHKSLCVKSVISWKFTILCGFFCSRYYIFCFFPAMRRPGKQKTHCKKEQYTCRRPKTVDQHICNSASSARHKELMKFISCRISRRRQKTGNDLSSACQPITLVHSHKENCKTGVFCGMGRLSHRIIYSLGKCFLFLFCPFIIIRHENLSYYFPNRKTHIAGFIRRLCRKPEDQAHPEKDRRCQYFSFQFISIPSAAFLLIIIAILFPMSRTDAQPVHMLSFLFHRRVHISVQRNIYIGMSQNFT